MPHSERVTGPHAFYLQLESSGLAMHMGALAIFDAGPLTLEDGVLDIQRLQRLLEWVLGEIPHARQRLRQVPFEQHPVWIDDDRFSLHYHLRHTRLPRPGSERQLKRLVGRLMSERLDRNKPLWEVWVIEGLEAGHVGFMLKVHPSVLEGAAIAKVLERMSSIGSDGSVPAVPTWRARPAPAPAQLIADSATFWARGALEALERTRHVMGEPASSLRHAAKAGVAVRGVLSEAVRGQARTPLNPPRIGVHRRVDVLDLPLDDVRNVADALGCSIPDVALSLLVCGVGRFFHNRGDKFEGDVMRILLTLPSPEPQDARAPVTIRIPMPYGPSDPVERVEATARLRAEALQSGQVEGFELLEQLEEWTPARVQRAISQTAGRHGTANILMHLFEGPPVAPRVLGAPLRGAVVFTPLFVDQALSVTVTTCGDRFAIGLNSDWDLLQDLHELVQALAKSFEHLQLSVLARASATSVLSETPSGEDRRPA